MRLNPRVNGRMRVRGVENILFISVIENQNSKDIIFSTYLQIQTLLQVPVLQQQQQLA